MQINKITKLKEKRTVYDLEVPKYHNFIVNGGLVVHNCIDAVRYATNSIWKHRGN